MTGLTHIPAGRRVSRFAPDRFRIMIVDDHEIMRLGLASLIASGTHGELPAILEAGTLARALELYALYQDSLALVFLDLHLPDAHGLSGLSQFLDRFPAAPVVVLSGEGDPAIRQQALKIGARAWLPKAEQLTSTIAWLRAQNLLAPLPAAEPLPAAAQATTDPCDVAARTLFTRNGERLCLTHRQAEMLNWILAGYSNREIAGKVFLAEGTVKNHVSALLLTFGVRSRAQLISQLR